MTVATATAATVDAQRAESRRATQDHTDRTTKNRPEPAQSISARSGCRAVRAGPPAAAMRCDWPRRVAESVHCLALRLPLSCRGARRLWTSQARLRRKSPRAPQPSDNRLRATTANFAPNDPPGEWHSQARDYANTRFSPLAEINAGNVAQLQRRLDLLRRHAERPRGRAARARRHDVPGDAVPEHRLRARPDASRARRSSGRTRRTRRRSRSARPAATPSTAAAPTPTARSSTTCSTCTPSPSTPRPARRSGARRWATSTHGETMTMAPFVVGNKVYVGNSGGELGVWGWLAALDVDTGKELWRAYSTGTDEQVQDRRRLQAVLFVDEGQGPRQDQLAAGHGPHRRRRRSGRWISYDPETNLIYYGTSNPEPARADAAPRLQPVDQRGLRARRRPPAWRSGPTSSRRTTSGTTTASTRTC